MDKYVKLIKDNRKFLLILLLVVNILAIIGLFKIQINPNFDIFMPQGSHYKEILENMEKNFHSTEQTIYLVETTENELNKDLIKQFRKIQDFLEKMKNIQYVNGPAPQVISLGTKKINLNQQINDSDLSFLKEHYVGMGKLSPVIKSNGKIYATFTAFHNEHFNKDDLERIEKFLSDNNISYYASGDIYMQQKIIDYILIILLFLPPTALILILSIFKTQMGSFKATFLSILPAGLAALWTMGIVGWLGKPVSIVTVLAPIFTIVIGSADGLHFISHVQENSHEGNNNIKSIINTLKMVGIPMIITTVTSMAGFLSLLVMNTDAIHDLAFFASIGIFLAGIATWYVLPLILTGKIKLSKPDNPNRFFTGKIKVLWGKPSIIITILLIIISIYGIQNVTTEFNQLMIYRDFTRVHQSFEKVMEINKGSVPVYLYINTNDDPLKPEYGSKLFEFENILEESPHIGKVISVYDIYSVIYSKFSNLDRPTYPGQYRYVNLIDSMLYKNSTNPTEHMLDRNKNTTMMMVFPINLFNKTLDKISHQVKEFTADSKDIHIKLTGVQYLMRELNDNMINNQINTLLLAFGIIITLLFISLKKLVPAIVSILPIAITVIILYGFLGYSGISLNLFTATIFSITLGVGIDYAVHFTSVWMSFRKQGYNIDEATEKSYNYTARPIMANALGLAIGLSALLFSPLRIHLYVSLLMWVSMISGVFLSLSFLPTLLRKVK